MIVKHLEMGQGPYTGLATLVAEELDADWAQMRAEGAPANTELYNNLAFGMQGTGGSTAMANSYEQMRKAGATARAMLVAAAAEAWKVPAPQITREEGRAAHASGQHATFGEFADAAARQTPPKDVKLKDPKDFTLIGHKLPRLDASAKSTAGRSSPSTCSCPRRSPCSCASAALRRQGRVLRRFGGEAGARLRRTRKPIPQGVAVYANNFWAAKKAREALKVEWDESGTERRSTDELVAIYRSAAQAPDGTATNRRQRAPGARAGRPRVRGGVRVPVPGARAARADGLRDRAEERRGARPGTATSFRPSTTR